MAFLEGVKDKISKASYSTVQKAKDLSEITKLNMAVSEAETKIKELYSDIGYKVYSSYKENPLPEVNAEINQITELYQAIEVCKLQIKAINAMNTCPRCGAKIKPDMLYCSKCGFRLIKEDSDTVESDNNEKPLFCSECGTLLEEEMAFCTNCGKKVEE